MTTTYWIVTTDEDRAGGHRDTGDRVWLAARVFATRSTEGEATQQAARKREALGIPFEAVEVTREGALYVERPKVLPMTDARLQAALLADGWQIMVHSGPGPRWGAIGGHEVAGLVCGLKAGGYTVRGVGEGCTVEVQVATAGEVLAAWGRVVGAVGMVSGGGGG